MLEAGSASLSSPTYRLRSERHNFAGLVSENIVPETYWIPQPPTLDRHFLLAELKRGREISGVELSNPKPTLAVRTK